MQIDAHKDTNLLISPFKKFLRLKFSDQLIHPDTVLDTNTNHPYIGPNFPFHPLFGIRFTNSGNRKKKFRHSSAKGNRDRIYIFEISVARESLAMLPVEGGKKGRGSLCRR